MDDMLKERIATLKADHTRAKEAWERARGNMRSKAEVSPESVETFGRLMRDRITEGETPGRKAWIGAIIDRIKVDHDHFRIVGRKDVLEQAVMSAGAFAPGVRTCVPKWRTHQDSNLRPSPSEGDALSS